MKKIVIQTTVTKLTPSLSLLLSSLNGKLIRTEVIRKSANTLLPECEDYYYGRGDIKFPFEVLSFSEKHVKCIEIYKFLKKFVTFGKFTTYGEIAKKFDLSPRLVGYCMKINPFTVVIPCHRVLAKHDLGGYSAGLGIKKELLQHERVI